MNMRLLQILRRRQGALIVACALLVFAASTDAEAQWSISAYAGSVHSTPARITVDQPASNTLLVFEDVDLQSRSFEGAIYYGYRVGRRVPGVQWLSVEAELIHAKLYLARPATTVGSGRRHGEPASDVPFTEVVQSFNLSHGMNFVLANAVMRRPVARRVTATARLGVGAMVPHVESEVDGIVRGDYQWAGAGLQLAGGAELRVWRAIALTAEYKWTGARQRVSLAAGHAHLMVVSHHAVVGMAAAF